MLVDGTFRDRFTIAPLTTLLYWITPTLLDIPAAPQWVMATAVEGNVIVRWEPNRTPSFFSYQVFLTQDDQPDTLLSPTPLRAAQWMDTAPPPGKCQYGIRTVSASGIASILIMSDPVIVATV